MVHDHLVLTLKSLSETRWSCRWETLNAITEQMRKINKALLILAKDKDTKTYTPLRKFPIGIFPIGIPIYRNNSNRNFSYRNSYRKNSYRNFSYRNSYWNLMGKIPIRIDNSYYRLIFYLDEKDKIYHYSSKEHPIISKIAKFGCKML
jgi:hypothetical protein